MSDLDDVLRAAYEKGIKRELGAPNPFAGMAADREQKRLGLSDAQYAIYRKKRTVRLKQEKEARMATPLSEAELIGLRDSFTSYLEDEDCQYDLDPELLKRYVLHHMTESE